MSRVEIRDGYAYFECGCKFEVIELGPPVRLRVDADASRLPLDCERTWNLIGEGNTKGVFQLETHFGQQYSKKLKPHNIEHLAALSAILRPGCISGDAQILISNKARSDSGGTRKKIKMRDLYELHHRNHPLYQGNIISYDENNHCLVPNKIVDVFYQGTKEVYNIKYRKRIFKSKWTNYHKTNYQLKCTFDHPVFVYGQGWTEVQNLVAGDRFVALSNGEGYYRKTRSLQKNEKNFQDICFRNYEYKCCMCDWDSGSLDVNHLDGNRKSDNSPENLSFLCPNHHRMYSEGNLSKQEIVAARDHKTLPQNKDLIWLEFQGMESCGDEDVFDIEVESPHHSFVADDIIVHNCLQAIRDGKSVTDHFILRKNGEEPVEYFHPDLERMLGGTFGEMIYQEQAMQIAQYFAGFDLQQADVLRKAIGKKKADIMAAVKKDFMEGCDSLGILTREEAEELFGWIEKSQRYSFNKSHAVSYAINSYLSAYLKAHFPVSFFTSYLYFAKDKKPKPFDEIKLLVTNAKLMDISIYPPDFRNDFAHFKRVSDQLELGNVPYNPWNDKIYFGFGDIREVGDSSIEKIKKGIFQAETALNKKRKDWTWIDFLMFFSQEAGITSTSINAMIEAGALDYFRISRTRMMFEYEHYSAFTNKEQTWMCQYVYDPMLSLKDIVEKAIKNQEVQELKKKPDKGMKCFANKNRTQKAKGILQILEKPPRSLEDNLDWIARIEESRLGTSITASIIDSCKGTEQANCTLIDFIKHNELNSGIFIACQIESIKTHTTRNEEEMAFITLTDGEVSLDGVCFSDSWEEVKKTGICYEQNMVMVSGDRSNRNDGLIIKKIWQLT